MAYQSIHTGNNIDEGISINSTQNTRLNNAETKITTLQNSLYNTGSQNQFLIKGANNTTSWKTLVTPSVLIFQNKSIATSAWVSDTVYEDYPYKTNISCSGVDANYFPEVAFNMVDATSGIFSPISESGSGIVTIWASEVPDHAVVVNIKCSKAG